MYTVLVVALLLNILQRRLACIIALQAWNGKQNFTGVTPNERSRLTDILLSEHYLSTVCRRQPSTLCSVLLPILVLPRSLHNYVSLIILPATLLMHCCTFLWDSHWPIHGLSQLRLPESVSETEGRAMRVC